MLLDSRQADDFSGASFSSYRVDEDFIALHIACFAHITPKQVARFDSRSDTAVAQYLEKVA